MAQCKRHSKIETNLYCGKCGDPICPKCMVETPVGARCPSCARMSRLPVFQVSGKYILRAIGAGVGSAALIGLTWAIIRNIVFFGFFGFLVGAAVGYGIGEVISLAANRKRSAGLAIIAGISVVISYIISIIVPWGRPFFLTDIIALIIGIVVSVMRAR